jgi:hypothetical protein
MQRLEDTLTYTGEYKEMEMPDAVRASRIRHVERQGENYDPEERLLKKWFGPAYSYNWYTRNAYAHPTRDSLGYAVDLLDTYNSNYVERASHVISRIIEIQEDDSEHEHFGVWPHLMEEPLGQGPYVDRNWADFLGKDLLHIMIYHADRLDQSLVSETEASLQRACEAIRIRNVRPDYTNIAVMGSYDILVSGETLGDVKLIDCGLEKLKALHAYVRENGTFTEYNSPTYTMVALRDLATFRHHVENATARQLVDDLFRLSWEIVAHHFHLPTRQWAGPNSRSYNDMSVSGAHRTQGILRTIEEWTSAAVDFGLKTVRQDPTWACMDATCPQDLEAHFLSLEKPRTLVKEVVKHAEPSHVATTYLTPELALGSINHQDTWNQRRNVLAFWGTTEDPSCLKVRLIYDGYDLSTGAIWTRQNKHCVLGCLTFATDGGGKHLSLEKLQNGTFSASELVLRFELSGHAAAAKTCMPEDLNDPVRVTHQGINLAVHIPYAVFDSNPIAWQATSTEDALNIDVVIHRGEAKTFVLPEIEEAAIAFALHVGGEGPTEPAKAERSGDRLEITWMDLSLTVPTRPDTYKAMRASATGLD